jgi:hypothetical protein
VALELVGPGHADDVAARGQGGPGQAKELPKETAGARKARGRGGVAHLDQKPAARHANVLQHNLAIRCCFDTPLVSHTLSGL